MRRAEQGFTLLELVVVIAILAIVLGVVITRAPNSGGALQTRAAAGALAQALRGARAAAMERSMPVSVAIDPARHSFAPDFGAVRLIDPTLRITVLPPALHGPGDVRLIQFAPDGSATGGAVMIGNGKRRLLVAVEWLTGRVQVSDAPAS
jgi:general secretion pathway protein H